MPAAMRTAAAPADVRERRTSERMENLSERGVRRVKSDGGLCRAVVFGAIPLYREGRAGPGGKLFVVVRTAAGDLLRAVHLLGQDEANELMRENQR